MDDTKYSEEDNGVAQKGEIGFHRNIELANSTELGHTATLMFRNSQLTS